jgi:hypothetical protein
MVESDMQNKNILGAAVALALAFTAGSAAATTEYNVKIGGSTTGTLQGGAAVLGTSSSWWNDYAYTSSTPNKVSIVNDAGVTDSSVTLTISNSGGVGSLSNSTGSPSFLMSSVRYQNPTGIWTIELDGLAANTTYSFVGYSAWINGSTGYGGTWSVLTGTAGAGTYTNTGSSVDISTGVGQAYVEFLVTTNSAGTVIIQDTSSSYVPIEGFQIALAVPEPSSILMMLGGGALLALRSRKKKRLNTGVTECLRHSARIESKSQGMPWLLTFYALPPVLTKKQKLA